MLKLTDNQKSKESSWSYYYMTLSYDNRRSYIFSWEQADQLCDDPKYNTDKLRKWRGLTILLTAIAYFSIFWIYPSKALLTGLIKDCTKKFKPWIISMLGQSILVFVLFFVVLPLFSWERIYIRCLFGNYVIDQNFIYRYIEHYWWLIILIVLVPQMIVWTVAIKEDYRDKNR